MKAQTSCGRNSLVRSTARRFVRAEALAQCPFSVAQDYANAFLDRAESGEDELRIRVPIGIFPTIIGKRVALRFGLHNDDAEWGRRHDEFQVHWTTGTPLLPAFRGTVRFRIAALATNVLVEGSYIAPLGFVGRLFDALIGSRIAHASVRDLAIRLADYLELRNKEWLSQGQ